MKLFKNKRGSELVEKIIMVAFSVAMGGALIVYSAGVINNSKRNPTNYLVVTQDKVSSGELAILKTFLFLVRIADENHASKMGLAQAKRVVECDTFYFEVYKDDFTLRGNTNDFGAFEWHYNYPNSLKMAFTTGTFTSVDGTYTQSGCNLSSQTTLLNVLDYHVSDELQTEWGISLPEK